MAFFVGMRCIEVSIGQLLSDPVEAQLTGNLFDRDLKVIGPDDRMDFRLLANALGLIRLSSTRGASRGNLSDTGQVAFPVRRCFDLGGEWS